MAWACNLHQTIRKTFIPTQSNRVWFGDPDFESTLHQWTEEEGMEICENASDQESVNEVYYEKSDRETDSEIEISDIEEAEEINSHCSQQNGFLNVKSIGMCYLI